MSWDDARSISIDMAISDVLRWFEFEHLPSATLRETSSQFYDMAHHLAATLPKDTETVQALRDLVRAKDCAVRAMSIGMGTAEKAPAADE